MEEEVALSYAEALLDAAVEAGKDEKIAADLELVAETVSAHPDFSVLLAHPKIGTDEKKRVLGDVFGRIIDRYTKNFLFLLLDRKRFGYLSMIHRAFSRLRDKLRERVTAEVVSAVRLSEDQKQKLKDSLKFVRGRVVLKETVNPKLLGGVIVKIEDQIWDDSLRRHLEGLSEYLMSEADLR